MSHDHQVSQLSKRWESDTTLKFAVKQTLALLAK